MQLLHQALLALAQALILFAPLLVAAALSAVVIRGRLLESLKRPIDGGRSLWGARLFGDSKTWRGVAVAVVGGACAAVAQDALFDALGLTMTRTSFVVLDHEGAASAAAFGALIGLGAMLGELPNSFVKRHVGIAPGKTAKGPQAALFYVWDQVDLLIGAWPFVALWVSPRPSLVVASFVLAVVLHPFVSVIGWMLGARKTAR